MVWIHSIIIFDITNLPKHSTAKEIGKAMIFHLIEEYRPAEICAQTDDDAVGFYRHLGFEINMAEEKYKEDYSI